MMHLLPATTTQIWYFSILSLGVGINQALQNRPVIGIVTVPTASVHNANLTGYGSSFIPASYVKWIESAGARVLPMPFDSPPAELGASFKAINGLLFPGGGANIYEGAFADRSTLLLNMAANASRHGNSLPVWGTCQGFEQVVEYYGGGKHVLSNVDAEGLFVPLNFTVGAEKSPMLRHISPAVLSILSTKNVTVNLHSQGLLLEKYRTTPKLQSAFEVLATNLDRAGKRFVSLIQGRDLQFYATQFHPEKNGFEFDQVWDPNATEIHGMSGIRMAQSFANFFVGVSRDNRNVASDKHWLESKLVYNFAPVYTSNVFPGRNLWEQAYFFNPAKSRVIQIV